MEELLSERISTHPKQIGGVIKKLNETGYILIKVGTQWKEEHRLVIENILGRLLEHNEVIHHIDFNKTNNNPNNLALFESQQAHAHWHRQFRQFGWTQPLTKQIKVRVCNLKVVTKI